jgi:predicted nicotinamide N-methyase
MTNREANQASERAHNRDAKLKEEDDDEDILAQIGFMFEGSHPTQFMQLEWAVPTATAAEGGDDDDSSGKQRAIRVALHAIDDEPGAVQSGHYLWPGATLVSDYLVNNNNNNGSQKIASVLELGAGCALASLVALQLWQRTLQCVVVTDHDAGVLARGRDNYESTIESILNASRSDFELNQAISDVGSIPVIFEMLEWGRSEDSSLGTIREQVREHTNSSQSTFDIVLGSDLIYCVQIVEPLFQTVQELMSRNGRFLLSQSFRFDDATELELDRVCQCIDLVRAILLDTEGGSSRIQEFRFHKKEVCR